MSKRKGTDKIFEETIVENFPNMENEIVNQVQEAQRVPYRINPRRNTPRHILIKLTKTKHKDDPSIFVMQTGSHTPLSNSAPFNG